MPAESGADASREEVTRLINRRDQMQLELDALVSVLESHNVTMDTPLVTDDGFPRADIDVAQIRATRAHIIRLKNDYKALMAQIEQGLGRYFAAANQNGSSGDSSSLPQANGSLDKDKSLSASTTTTSTTTTTTTTTNEPYYPPFAKVQSVEPNSPASIAGLQPLDKICTFGLVDATNHRNLSRLATVVATHAEIPMTVIRGNATQPLELMLIPNSNWGGRGSIGCHIVPL